MSLFALVRAKLAVNERPLQQATVWRSAPGREGLFRPSPTPAGAEPGSGRWETVGVFQARGGLALPHPGTPSTPICAGGDHQIHIEDRVMNWPLTTSFPMILRLAGLLVSRPKARTCDRPTGVHHLVAAPDSRSLRCS